jgi:hypothetical protein
VCQKQQLLCLKVRWRVEVNMWHMQLFALTPCDPRTIGNSLQDYDMHSCRLHLCIIDSSDQHPPDLHTNGFQASFEVAEDQRPTLRGPWHAVLCDQANEGHE